MAVASLAESGRAYIFLLMMGLFIGSLIGAMAEIIPYALVLLTAMGVSVLAWRQDGSVTLTLIMISLLIGSLFGNMANVMPYGVTVFFGVLLAVMIWRTQGGGISTSGPTSTIALILFIITAVGFLWNGTNMDFCNPNNIPGFNACLSPQATGYITAYQGCFFDCAITSFTFLGNSPLAFIVNGDFIGFFQSMIQGVQSGINIGGIFSVVASLITFVVGAILLFLGSGIFLQAEAATIGGQVGANEAGTREFQSLGIALIMWAAMTGLIFGFGQFFGYLGFGLGTGTGSSAAGGAIYLMFLITYTYEAYRQGKTITA